MARWVKTALTNMYIMAMDEMREKWVVGMHRVCMHRGGFYCCSALKPPATQESVAFSLVQTLPSVSSQGVK